MNNRSSNAHHYVHTEPNETENFDLTERDIETFHFEQNYHQQVAKDADKRMLDNSADSNHWINSHNTSKQKMFKHVKQQSHTPQYGNEPASPLSADSSMI